MLFVMRNAFGVIFGLCVAACLYSLWSVVQAASSTSDPSPIRKALEQSPHTGDAILLMFASSLMWMALEVMNKKWPSEHNSDGTVSKT